LDLRERPERKATKAIRETPAQPVLKVFRDFLARTVRFQARPVLKVRRDRREQLGTRGLPDHKARTAMQAPKVHKVRLAQLARKD